MHPEFNRKYLRAVERLPFLPASQRYLSKASVVVVAAAGGWAASKTVSLEPAMRLEAAAVAVRSKRPKPSQRYPMGSPWRADNSSPLPSVAAEAAAAVAESISRLAPTALWVSTASLRTTSLPDSPWFDSMAGRAVKARAKQRLSTRAEAAPVTAMVSVTIFTLR